MTFNAAPWLLSWLLLLVTMIPRKGKLWEHEANMR